MHQAIARLRPSARTGLGTPGITGTALAGIGASAVVVGIRRRGLTGAALALVGSGVAYRGLTGTSLIGRLVDLGSATRPRLRLPAIDRGSNDSEIIWASITVNREREPIYLFWRETGNLPLLRGWITGIGRVDDDVQRWRISGPGVEADVEMRLAEDVPLDRVVWESAADLEGDPFRVRVDLRDGPGRRGTEVVLTVRLPARTGSSVPPLRAALRSLAEAQVHEMLRRSRQWLETGELSTVDGQSSGRAPVRDDAAADRRDAAPRASELRRQARREAPESPGTEVAVP